LTETTEGEAGTQLTHSPHSRGLTLVLYPHFRPLAVCRGRARLAEGANLGAVSPLSPPREW